MIGLTGENEKNEPEYRRCTGVVLLAFAYDYRCNLRHLVDAGRVGPGVLSVFRGVCINQRRLPTRSGCLPVSPGDVAGLRVAGSLLVVQPSLVDAKHRQA